jgi:hypothetical protein
MTEKEFLDMIPGYIGEFRFKIKAKKPRDVDVTITAQGNSDHQIDGSKVPLLEIFAESIWGRSYVGMGTLHWVEIQDIEPVWLKPIAREDWEKEGE